MIVHHAGQIANTVKRKSASSPKGIKRLSREPKCSLQASETLIPSSSITENIQRAKQGQDAAAEKIDFAKEEEKEVTKADDVSQRFQVDDLEDLNDRPQENCLPAPVVNAEAGQILSELRQILPLNPQLKTKVLKYSLAEVKAAIALYQTRKQTTDIKSSQG